MVPLGSLVKPAIWSLVIGCVFSLIVLKTLAILMILLGAFFSFMVIVLIMGQVEDHTCPKCGSWMSASAPRIIKTIQVYKTVYHQGANRQMVVNHHDVLIRFQCPKCGYGLNQLESRQEIA